MDLSEALKNPSTHSEPAIKQSGEEDDVIEFSEHGSFSLSLFLLWLTAVLCLLGTVFFWFLNQSANQQLDDANQEKNLVISEILSPTYANTEKDATSFKSAVEQLESAVASSYKYSEFLPLFYTKIDKDVTLSSFSIGSSGQLLLSGTTDSYRSAAEQSVALQEWQINDKEILKDVDLSSVSENVSGDEPIVQFTISATINKSVGLKDLSVTDLTGGEDAQNQ